MLNRRSFIAAVTSALSSIGLLSRQSCKAAELKGLFSRFQSVAYRPGRNGQPFRVMYRGRDLAVHAYPPVPEYSQLGGHVLREHVTKWHPMVSEDGRHVYAIEWLIELESDSQFESREALSDYEQKLTAKYSDNIRI